MGRGREVAAEPPSRHRRTLALLAQPAAPLVLAAVALAASAVLVFTAPWALLAVPPLGAVLYFGIRARIRATEDRRRWRELAVARRRLWHAAAHDPVTGVASRARVVSEGDATLRRLAEAGPDGQVVLLLIDLDNFTAVNETLGMPAGDEVLRGVAARLSAVTEPGEVLGRVGGDEFALLAVVPPGRDAAGYALDRAAGVALAVARTAEVAGVAVTIETSIGAASAVAGACGMTELVRRAGVALSRAKRGARIVSYDAAFDHANTDRLTVLSELRAALSADDQLCLALQPTIDLVTGGPVAAEALVRWRHPRRGLLSPHDFIDVVEQSDLVGPFTERVLDLALVVAADWAEAGLPLPVAVNLSARNLRDPALPEEVAAALRRHGVPASRLILEITETVMLDESSVVDDVLSRLRALGAQVAVDDFGTGYSSLRLLTRFRVDEVKVDRAFVAAMAHSAEAAAIVRTTVDLARSLGLRVVAEGVESAEQRDALAAMGCTAAQGYHFSPPLWPDRARAALAALYRPAGEGGPARRVIPLADQQHAG